MAKKVTKAQAKAAQKAFDASITEALESAKLSAKMELYKSPAFATLKVNEMMTAETTNKLESLHAQMNEIVTSMPIMNATTRQERKWNPTQQYSLGNQVRLLSGLLSGIMYSAQDHRTQMLAVTGLTQDLIESTVEAFGSVPYYNRNYQVVVEAKDYDLDTLLGNLTLIADTLDIQLDTKTLKPATMDARIEKARLQAEAKKEEDAAAQALPGGNDQTLKID